MAYRFYLMIKAANHALRWSTISEVTLLSLLGPNDLMWATNLCLAVENIPLQATVFLFITVFWYIAQGVVIKVGLAKQVFSN